MRQFAFFDVDETIVREKTMFTILSELGRSMTALNADAVTADLRALRVEGESREAVNRAFYRALAGLDQEAVRSTARTYVQRRMAGMGSDFLISPVVERLQALKKEGVEPVLVSGSSIDFIEPIAEALDILHILATRSLCDQGLYTGEIEASMIGEGKRRAVVNFLNSHGADSAHCWGFGDHPSDLDFLSLLGHPHAVGGDAVMRAEASLRGWPVIETETTMESV